MLSATLWDQRNALIPLNRKTIALFSSRSGVWPIIRRASNMTATPAASSAAPGEGSVLSRCALTRIAFSLLAGVPSDSLTTTFEMPIYFFQTFLSMKSKRW